jgi:hypothetical protein
MNGNVRVPGIVGPEFVPGVEAWQGSSWLIGQMSQALAARAVSVADAVRAAREIPLQQLPDELRHTLALAPRLLFRRVPELGEHAGQNLRGVPTRSSQ